MLSFAGTAVEAIHRIDICPDIPRSSIYHKVLVVGAYRLPPPMFLVKHVPPPSKARRLIRRINNDRHQGRWITFTVEG